MCICDWPEGSSHYSDGFWTTDAAVHGTDAVRLWAMDGAARYEVRVCAAGQWIYHDSSTYEHGQMQTGDADSSAARVSLVAYAATSLTTSFGRLKSRAALVYLASRRQAGAFLAHCGAAEMNLPLPRGRLVGGWWCCCCC